MKFCKDCRFAKVEFLTTVCMPSQRWKYAKCTWPELEDREEYFMASGRRNVASAPYCSTTRLFDCGEEAKFFEPR